jgi:hypothetical protein
MEDRSSRTVGATVSEEETSSPFFKKCGSRLEADKQSGFRSAKSALQGRELMEMKQGRNASKGEERPFVGPKAQLKLTYEQNENTPLVSSEPPDTMSFEAKESRKDETVGERYKDLEPWFLKEFGDVVELIDE